MWFQQQSVVGVLHKVLLRSRSILQRKQELYLGMYHFLQQNVVPASTMTMTMTNEHQENNNHNRYSNYYYDWVMSTLLNGNQSDTWEVAYDGLMTVPHHSHLDIPNQNHHYPNGIIQPQQQPESEDNYSIWFAVPKQKISHQKKRMKTTLRTRIPVRHNIIVDPRTGQLTLRHHLPVNWRNFLPKKPSTPTSDTTTKTSSSSTAFNQ
jgi:ribosomal protein L32